MRRPLCEMVTDLVIRRRLEEAFDTLEQLPTKDRPRGYPRVSCIAVADHGMRADVPRPTRAQITQAEEALGWLEHLQGEGSQVRRAVQLRARGQSLRQMARELRCSHVWAGRLEARGVAVIVAALRRLDLLPGLSTVAQGARPVGALQSVRRVLVN